MIKEISNLSEFYQALEEAGNRLVVVDFSAAWCGPCRKISPIFKAMSEDPAYANVVFLKVDVDDAEDVSSAQEISTMPTFRFFKEGKKIKEFQGANVKMLRELLNALK